MSSTSLSAEQEAEAQRLAARIREVSDEDILALARLLLSKSEKELFGQTAFEVRGLVQQLAAKAYETHLAEKKQL